MSSECFPSVVFPTVLSECPQCGFALSGPNSWLVGKGAFCHRRWRRELGVRGMAFIGNLGGLKGI